MCVCEHMTLVSVDGQHPSAQGEGGLRVGDTVGPLAMPATVKKGINKTKETMRKEKKQTKQIIRRRKRTGKKHRTQHLCARMSFRSGSSHLRSTGERPGQSNATGVPSDMCCWCSVLEFSRHFSVCLSFFRVEAIAIRLEAIASNCS